MRTRWIVDATVVFAVAIACGTIVGLPWQLLSMLALPALLIVMVAIVLWSRVVRRRACRDSALRIGIGAATVAIVATPVSGLATLWFTGALQEDPGCHDGMILGYLLFLSCVASFIVGPTAFAVPRIVDPKLWPRKLALEEDASQAV